MSFDPARIAAEIAWLKKNPEFREKPATLIEFLGEDYLNIESGVRERIKEVLSDIIGHDVDPKHITAYSKALITGGIGIGKTTIASIVLPYLCHWVMCLNDPQGYFDLLPGSRIAFMQMSTSEDQAKEVVFGDIKARIKYSPWFRDNAVIDPNYKNQIRFEGDIWILPGDSSETTFEGYNILGGILDEMDSHKVTANTDYAENGYNTIHGRMTSRFQDRGCVLLIGQMKKADGFAKRMYDDYMQDPKAYAVRMTIWESFGWEKFLNDDGTRDSFWYDIKRKQIIPTGIASTLGEGENIIEVPTIYRRDFENNPEKALKDLAGIPPAVGDPFISLTHKLEEARDRWVERNDGLKSPFVNGRLEKWFTAQDSLRRHVHIDIGYSPEGDAAGLAMGHVREVVEIEGELKPYIVIDLLARWKAPAGSEIMIADLRRMVYDLKDGLGFRIVSVSLDGFQSTDTIQQLRKKRYQANYVSMDKSKLPYSDLRDAIYEDRIEWPEYMVHMAHGDTKQIEVVYKELTELTDVGMKIDHPPRGSKDVADCMAGVAYTLMGDRSYRRNVRSLGDYRAQKRADLPRTAGGAGIHAPALGNLPPLVAPQPPPALLPGLHEEPRIARPEGRP
jgi:hypothetical protein